MNLKTEVTEILVSAIKRAYPDVKIVCRRGNYYLMAPSPLKK